MAAVKGAGMLWDLTDTLHLDMTETWMRPLVNAVFDKALDHGRSAKKLEVQFVVYPDRSCLGRAHAEGQWADFHWSYIVRRSS